MARPVWMDAMGRCDSVGRRWRARVNEYDGDGGDGDDGVFRFVERGGANANGDETATTIVVFGIISSRASMRAFGW